MKKNKTEAIKAIMEIMQTIILSDNTTITLDEEIKRDSNGRIIGKWQGITLSSTKSFDAETGEENTDEQS